MVARVETLPRRVKGAMAAAAFVAGLSAVPPSGAAMARDGEELPIRRGEFEYEFDLSFDIQSATAAGKMLAAEELFELYDRGIVDEQYVIEQQELPGAKELIQRAMQRRQEEMQVQLIAALAGAKENAGGSKGGGAKPKSSSDKGEMSKSRKQTAGTR